MLRVSKLLLQPCQMSSNTRVKPQLLCFWPPALQVREFPGPVWHLSVLLPKAGLFLRDLGLLLTFSKVLSTLTPSVFPLCFQRTWDKLWRKRGPELTHSYQVNPHPERLVMQTDSKKTDGSRLLDSLVDLREGNVFLSGREPWCRNRLKPGKRAAAVAEAVYLNLFAVWPSGPEAKFTYRLFSMFLHLER